MHYKSNFKKNTNISYDTGGHLRIVMANGWRELKGLQCMWETRI